MPHRTNPRDTDWDLEWERAWKAHRANSWFRYQAEAYGAWVEKHLGPLSAGGAVRVLKTDAFEEACGFRFLQRSLAGHQRVLMDVSPRILARAVDGDERNERHALACATDVRRLGLRSAAFDLIVSPSTLDHFADERDIAASLDELHRALRPGGYLVISLDNPANPILRVRRAVHRFSGPVGGLIPFPMGRTLSRSALVRALTRCGFEVMESGYLVHAPRLFGLWLAEWTARRGTLALGKRLHDWLWQWDRALAVAPLRRWTAHFVIAACRRPPSRPGA